MKRLMAVLCACALLVAMMGVAFAAGSISKPEITGKGEEETESGWWYEVRDVNPDAYRISTLKDIVNAVNEEVAVESTESDDTEDTMTVRKAVEAMQSYLPEGTTLDENGVVTIQAAGADKEDTVIDLNEYDFVTEFKDVVYTNGKEAKYVNGDGEDATPTLTLTVDALKGADDLNGYQLMVMHPETGETHFLDLSKDLAKNAFDSATGTLKVQFPGLGAFSLIQK